MTKNDDETEWEGFDSPENNVVVQSDLMNLNLGPSSRRKSRKPESARRKNPLSLQKNSLPIDKDEDQTGNSFKVLESAVDDEVDGTINSILYIGGSC